MDKKTLFKEFKETGRDIFLRGLISSHAGNMSVKIGDTIHITKKSSMLGRLRPGDIVEVDLERDNTNDPKASTELVVHRAIYKKTSGLAIVHTHPPYATLLSMVKNKIVPVDSEGLYLFQKASVVSPETTIGSEEAALLVSNALQNSKVVLIGGHGSFALGNTLEEAFMLTTSLEASAFLLYHLHGLGN
ncbi:MAG: Methylthioribulose-1-phosphate dehydratase [Syntrophorhabdus sp. PtaU1.Bin153]|nr:MAG: Methylthioribulose-1-phosphate dehydratase [Syntrophorhabdus sp. PtaU1.Bin153]